MKNILYISILLVSTLGYGQTQNQNYVKSTTFQEPYTQTEVTAGNIHDSHKIEGTTYVDGLGRPVQSVIERSGNNNEDLVTPIDYDGQGRQSKQYLPYPISGNNGAYVVDPFNDQETFYVEAFPDDDDNNGGINAFSHTTFEASPLGRPLEQGAPGESWKVNASSNTDHTIKYDYQLNLADVEYFTVDLSSGNDSPQLQHNGGYGPNKLYVTVTRDENWQPTDGIHGKNYEYKNRLGQVVLKRNTVADPSKGPTQPNNHDTYYVYDDFGNLTYVLSPEASAQILDSNGNLITHYQTVLDELGYQYKYDYRNRLVEKKVPGKDWEYILYDLLDRPVLTQDRNLRDDGSKWLFTKYDDYGRVAYTGIYTPPAGQDKSHMANALKGPQYVSEERTATASNIGGTLVYYTNWAYPNYTSDLEVLTVNYYDDYNVSHAPTVLPTNVLGQVVSTTVQGLPTVAQIRTLDLSQDDWTTTLTAYDDKGRAIYADSYSDYHDSRDITKSLLDFTGKVSESETQHIKTGNPTITTRDYFTYDHMARLVTHRQKIDDEEVQLIAHNTYDNLGQLVNKGVGGASLLDGYTDLTNASVTPDGTITFSGNAQAYDAYLKTRGTIPSGYAGYIDLIIGQANQHVRFGFDKTSSSNPGEDYDYGIHIRLNGQVNYWDPGTSVWAQSNISAQQPRTYTTGDLFRVERVEQNGVFYIKYWHNNDEFFSHTLNSGGEDVALIGKVSASSTNAIVNNLNINGPLLDSKLQRIDYAYNIRGWLTDINDIGAASAGNKGLNEYSDLFNFRITYDQTDGSTGATPLYNGNISQTFWKTENSDTNVRGYDYLYDDLNRILSASGHKGANLSSMTTYDHHDLSQLAYDRNGNITALQRRGANGTDTASGVWDDLGYSYKTVNGITTNQLLNVLDSANDFSYMFEGFKDGNVESISGNDDYDYDFNGNMTVDRNKGISSITYNHLNLPEVVTINNGTESGTITYAYDATGMKLKKTVAIAGQTPKDILYVGGYVYEDSDLQFFPHPEGYIEPVAGTSKSIGISVGGSTSYTAFNYVFQYKDHLGNIRLSYTDGDGNGSVGTSEIVEESNYYPYGLKHSGYNVNVSSNANNLAQRFKSFQGQEINEDLGINWHEWKYRMSDPAIGRFISIDPLAEDYVYNATYAFSENRPIDSFEREGLERIFASDGSQLGLVGDSDEIRVMSTKSNNDDVQSQIKNANDPNLTDEERASARNSLMENSFLGHKNTDEAAISFAMDNNIESLKAKKEIGSALFTLELSTGVCGDCSIIEGTNNNEVSLVAPAVMGKSSTVSVYDMEKSASKAGVPGELSGIAHTHHVGNPKFSRGGGGFYSTDESISKDMNVPIYVANKWGQVRKGDFHLGQTEDNRVISRDIPTNIFEKQ